MECIGNSDALYHNIEHSMHVTLAWHEIPPGDYANFILACLTHDTGYVCGIVQGDDNESYIADLSGRTVCLPRGSSDAALTPYHVDRSKLFVFERSTAPQKLTPAELPEQSNIRAFPIRHLRTTISSKRRVCCCALPISSANLEIPTT